MNCIEWNRLLLINLLLYNDFVSIVFHKIVFLKSYYVNNHLYNCVAFIAIAELTWRSGIVLDCHATARGLIPGGNGIKTELHVLRKGQ